VVVVLLPLVTLSPCQATPLQFVRTPYIMFRRILPHYFTYGLPTQPVVLDPDVDYKCSNEGVFVNPEDCGSYFVCNNNGFGLKATKVDCPGAGDNSLAFNEQLGFCDWAQRVPGCEPKESSIPTEEESPPRGLGSEPKPEPILVDPTVDYTCTQEGLFYNPEDCQSYIVCNPKPGDDYKPAKVSCVHGLFFNSELKVCDYPVNVPDCATRTVATNPVPKPQPVVSCEIDPATGRVLTEVPCTSPIMACSDGTFRATCDPVSETWWWTVEENPENFDCGGKSVGTYEDPTDCAKYFVCSGDGRSFRYSCSEGTVYDVQTRECVFEDVSANVCGDRKVSANRGVGITHFGR